MRKRTMPVVALIRLPVCASLFASLIKSQSPMPVGDPGCLQAHPFGSNLTDGAYNGVGI